MRASGITSYALCQGYRLAQGLVGDSNTACKIVIEALCSVDTYQAKQNRRRYYKAFLRHNKASLEPSELFQYLICEFSQKYEITQEEECINGQRALQLEMLIARYLKCIVHNCVPFRSFHLTVGVCRLIFNFSPNETRKVYGVLTQDRDDCKDDKDYTAWKSKLTRTLEERFNKFLTPSNCVKGQLPFLCKEGAESLAKFVEKWLELLKPLTPRYDVSGCRWVPPTYGEKNQVVPALTFNGKSPDAEQAVERQRRHVLLHSPCFSRLITPFLHSPGDIWQRLQVPHFSVPKNGGGCDEPPLDPEQLPEPTVEEMRLFWDSCRDQHQRRTDSSTPVLSIQVDGSEHRLWDRKAEKSVWLKLQPDADLIQVFAKEKDCDLLLSTLSLKYSQTLEQDQPWKSSVVLESGSKIGIIVFPTKDSTGKVSEVSVGINYRERARVGVLLTSLQKIKSENPDLLRFNHSHLPRLMRKPVFSAIALIIIAFWALFYFLVLSNRTTEAAINSLAILPQVESGADPDGEYLSYGIAIGTIKTISQVGALTVTGDDTAYYYLVQGGTQERLKEKLEVDGIVKVTIRQDGGNLVVRADLRDRTAGRQIWSKEYNLSTSDVLSVQKDIAREIPDQLRLKLSVEERRQLTKQCTEDAEANRLYLKGRYFWNKRKKEELKKAIEYFKQAIDLDPNYALAYAGLADAYILLPSYGDIPTRLAYPEAEAAAIKALQIDDTLAEAHTSLAQVKEYYHWDWTGAEKEYKRAIELNQNYATAHHWYGYYLTRMGQLEKGMSELRRAYELDPLSPIINTELGWALMWSRQYDQAVEQLRKTLELAPNFPRALEQLGEAYALQGKPAEAVEELIKAEAINGTSSNEIKTLRDGFLVSGWEGYLRKQLDLAIKDASLHGISAGYIATMYARLGNKEEAFKWLEKAYQAHEGEMGGLKVNPHWDNLRADPRFANLIRRVGLP